MTFWTGHGAGGWERFATPTGTILPWVPVITAAVLPSSGPSAKS
ncbi:hypothetical protein [Streptomyces sp. KL2]